MRRSMRAPCRVVAVPGKPMSLVLSQGGTLRSWSLAAVVMCTLLCGTSRSLHAAPAWRERYLATLTLCRSGDAASCRDSLLAMRALLPGHPGVVYRLARAAARAGDGVEVLRALNVYAGMGLVAHPATDTTFSRWAGEAEFVRVAARLARNAEPLAHSRIQHRMNDRDLLSEDVAFDPVRRRLLVSSIRAHCVIAIDAAGHESKMALRGGPRPWGIYALGVDAGRRRLWIGTAATPESGDTARSVRGRAALRCYDLDKDTLLAGFEAPDSSVAHVFGDMTVAADGSVYVTDSVGGGVYRARLGTSAIERVVAPGVFVSPQSPVVLARNQSLIVADYSRGLAAVSLSDGSLSWLAQPDSVATAGIDGLYAWRGRLVAIQNGVEPHRVLLLELDANARSITRTRVLEQASPELGEPNHGTFVGDDFVLIGNSGWERVGEDGGMADATDARPPVLLRLKLQRPAAGKNRDSSGGR